ncbi:MAG TPA: secretin N-terminal domain-containing protein, partial [Planctomycetota bacterium]|nr:secretin N-terminal domain-containing protein [Planctomycetota bacterium]
MRCIALAALVLALAGPSLAQDISVQGDDYFLQFDETEGEPMSDFIDLAQKLLNRPIKYTPGDVSDQNARIWILGTQRIKRDEFFQYFQAILKAHDFLVVEYGPEYSNFLSIQKIQPGGGGRAGAGGTYYATQAPVVDVNDLDDYEHDPATLITTSMPLKYANARDALGTFSTLFSQPPEQIRNVENTNSLVVTGFGSHVWGLWQLIQLTDQPPFKPEPVIHKRVLQYASVDEVEQVLNDLLSASRGLRPGQAQAQQAAPTTTFFDIEPRIIAEPRSNSLLISGDEDTVQHIEEWIDVLDVEVEPRGDSHVYRLRNTDATEVAEVITSVLEQEKLSAQQRPGGQGGAVPGTGSSLEIQPSAVADRASNSVIITAGARKYAELVAILRNLDVRRPQVLIEAAIVETNGVLTEALNVGLGAIGGDAAFISNFGTPTGLETDLDVNEAIVGTGGNAAWISSGDLPIPFLLRALSTDTRNHILSRPSLLTNDNQEASISTVEQTSYATSTTTQTATSTGFSTVEAGISLTISPTISAGNYLRLRVKIEVSNFSPSSLEIEGAPPDITKREVETPVTLPDGHTVILGGLVLNNTLDTLAKTPWLGDLPLIGWLFRSTRDETRDRYLYVFITPHIIDTDFALLDEISANRKRDLDRLGGAVGLTADPQLVGSSADFRRPDAEVLGVFDLPD